MCFTLLREINSDVAMITIGVMVLLRLARLLFEEIEHAKVYSSFVVVSVSVLCFMCID